MNENRQTLNEKLLKGAENLDITPSMFGEANTHYTTLSEFLQNNGIEADISIYGSIATGTTVRPWSEDEDAYFDFDALCKLTEAQDESASAAVIRKNIESLLQESDRYGGRTDVSDDCCITVSYVQNGKDGGFRLDLCACVDDEGYADAPEPFNDSVQIAKKNGEWMGSNPIGLVRWFKEANVPYSKYSAVKLSVGRCLTITGLYTLPSKKCPTSLNALRFSERFRFLSAAEMSITISWAMNALPLRVF